ncbi:MAG: hypothetical protein EZS28_010024 [Streblomastix strix]|uniref:Uncharacterized protein n=1 Tax=Streblomastix strix TaxID=222440 RepID=A0A5J4WI00_9EUKA|nr:MAG: hypothetical protein EZS28_010024 [Streblomastix strix]
MQTSLQLNLQSPEGTKEPQNIQIDNVQDKNTPKSTPNSNLRLGASQSLGNPKSPNTYRKTLVDDFKLHESIIAKREKSPGPVYNTDQSVNKFQLQKSPVFIMPKDDRQKYFVNHTLSPGVGAYNQSPLVGYKNSNHKNGGTFSKAQRVAEDWLI